uniref:Uncharacterized protein isoform X2 n=1 Tax=Pogona vitticeps TaxID=103695 RepID=A0ABM5GM48_9SAUR
MEPDPPTLGDLLRTLYEMGFSERQVRQALHAGCLSAPEAANWLLQERMEQPLTSTLHLSRPAGAQGQRAMEAFSPPRRPQEEEEVSSGPGAPGPALGSPGCGPGVAEGAAPEAPRRAESQGLAEQQREQLVEQLKAERRDRRREHELALRRIADDRRHLQAKAQLSQALPVQPPAAPFEKKVQPLPRDGQCLLTIRLPAGDSVRESFPADSSLEGVRQHLLSQHPGLSPTFSFLQSFPKRRFGPADLPHTLQALGLAPSATVCIVDLVPGLPASEQPLLRPTPEATSEGPGQQPVAGERASAQKRGEAEPPLSSPAQRGAPGDPSRAHGRGEPDHPVHHHWGRGCKLDSEVPMEQSSGAATRQTVPLEDLPGRAAREPLHGHPWPVEGGNRLREADGSGAESLALPLAVAQAAEQRLQQVASQGAKEEEEEEERRQGMPGLTTPPGCLPPRVLSLFQLSLRGTLALLTAPSKQYCSSLAALTPGLAEQLLAAMIQQSLLTPRNLRLFFGCPLQKLCLDCYPYATNELLRQLRAFPSLRHLSLLACSVITDQGLCVLQHLSRLQQLNLSACTKLTDHCLQFLRGLPHLSHLALDQTHISDQGLAEFLLSAPPTLTHLSLNQTGITESTLGLLPQYARNLCVLSIKQTAVTDVSALRQLEALQALHLDGTRVAEPALRALASHPTLSRLTLSGAQSLDSDRALEIISGLPLVQFSLPRRQTVTDAGLTALCHLGGLLELDLSDCSRVTDLGLQHLAHLRRLRRLSLCNTLATDSSLQPVGSLQLLEELCLDRLHVSSLGVARCITSLPHLQVLSLASTPVGDTVARLGIARCPQLLKVNLSRTRLTDRGLRFLHQAPLVQLNLDGSGVTAPGVAALQAACPALGSIRASHLRTLAREEVSDEEGSS